MQFPQTIVPGLPLPEDNACEGFSADIHITQKTLDVLASNSDTVRKIVTTWDQLDKEQYSQLML